MISAVTRINHRHMTDFKNANVAVKMSWASNKKTTRVEDTAYCLMGLFGINMPLLYGEGANAFIRLQLEILKVSDEETIFAWNTIAPVYLRETVALLALSPGYFHTSGHIRRTPFDKDRSEYSMTNKGLRMELLLSEKLDGASTWHLFLGEDVYVAPLNCTREAEGYPVAIYLEKVHLEESGAPNEFHRFFPASITGLPTLKMLTAVSSPLPMRRETVYVKQTEHFQGIHSFVNMSQSLPRSFLLRYAPKLYQISSVQPRRSVQTDTKNNVNESEIWFNLEEEIFVMFASANQDHPESFVILLKVLGNSAVTNVAVFQEGPGLPTLDDIFRDLKAQELGVDSISRRFPSGGSVSITLRPRMVSDSHWYKSYDVDITVDENGRLLWPAPRTDESATLMDDPLERMMKFDVEVESPPVVEVLGSLYEIV